MSRRKLAAVSTAVGLSLGLAACGSGGDAQPGAPVASEDAGYPVKVVNCGRNIELEASPQRVVVMNTESVGEVSTLLELDAADKIITNAQNFGVSDVPGRAAAIAALPKGKYTPNDLVDIPRAAMLEMKPDLVVANTAAGFDGSLGFATRDQLAKIKANMYSPPHTCDPPAPGKPAPPVTIEDSYAMMRDLGMIFAATDRADQLIAESKAKIAQVQTKVKGRPPKRVAIALPFYGKGSNGDFAYVAGHGIWNDILAKAGGVNPFDDPKGTVKIVPKNPVLAKTKVDALIFVNYRNPHPAKTVNGIFLAFPAWEATKKSRYLVLSDSIYLGPSNHLAVERIARMLHPEAF